MEVYKSYSNCAIVNNGCDVGTFYIPVKSSDGKKIPLNIYVMDSNNKAKGEGLLTGYQGLKPEQVQWYKDTRDALKAETGDYVPSLVFQHVPVKEIYQFVDKVPFNADHTDCIFGLDDGQWYKLNDKATRKSFYLTLFLLVSNDILNELRANDINNSADPCCDNR